MLMRIKKLISKVLILTILSSSCLLLFSCSGKAPSQSGPSSQVESGDSSGSDAANSSGNQNFQGLANKKIAVVYFSAFDNIAAASEELASYLDADLIELEPLVPYEESDFYASNKSSRPLLESRYNLFEEETEERIDDYPLSYGVTEPETKESAELQKATELPKIKNINVNKYNVIFLGYPIWYNDAPKVIYTFLKDLKNKTIIPFTTNKNGGSILASEEIISNYVDDSVNVMGGIEFTGIATESEINAWLKLIDINI